MGYLALMVIIIFISLFFNGVQMFKSNHLDKKIAPLLKFKKEFEKNKKVEEERY